MLKGGLSPATGLSTTDRVREMSTHIPPVYRTSLTVMLSPESVPDESVPDLGVQLCVRGGRLRGTGARIKHSTGHKQSRLCKQVGRAGTEGELNPLFFGLGEPTGRKHLHA